MGSARALLAACHPLPSVAVTGFLSAYALTVGVSPARCALLAAAVLTGQLSIGWCNDAVDAARDTLGGRSDKPVALAVISRRTVAIAAGVALAGCVLLSVLLGPAAAVVHLVAVAAGWAYDLGLKSTVGSGVPYLIAFGLLPGVATWAAPIGRWPPPGVIAGAAVLGLAAHFANTVGDAAADAAAGVRGLPQRIGPGRSLIATAVLVALAGVGLLTGAPHRAPAALAVLGLGVALAVAGAMFAVRPPSGRTAFRLTLAAVGLVIAGFLLAS